MNHYVALRNGAGFHIFREFCGSCVLSERVIVMRKSKLMNTRTLSQFCGVLIGCLVFKVGEQAAGRGGATLGWPGGLLQDWHHRDQGMGAWNRPTVCLSRSSAEEKEQVTVLDMLLFASVFFTLSYFTVLSSPHFLSTFGSAFYRYHITDRYRTRWMHL